MWRSLPFPSCGWVGGWVGMKKIEMTQRGHFSSIEEGHRQGQRGEETRPPRTPSWLKAHFAAGWEEGVGAAGGRVGACLGMWACGAARKEGGGKEGQLRWRCASSGFWFLWASVPAPGLFCVPRCGLLWLHAVAAYKGLVLTLHRRRQQECICTPTQVVLTRSHQENAKARRTRAISAREPICPLART